MPRNLPVGASQGGLAKDLERKLDQDRPAPNLARRIFSMGAAVLACCGVLAFIGGYGWYVDGKDGFLNPGTIFGFLFTPPASWLAWRWARGKPAAKWAATPQEEADALDDD